MLIRQAQGALVFVVPESGCVLHHRADGLAFVHQVKRFVDLVQAHGVRDERRQLDLAGHGVFDHAGQFAAALDAAKGRAQPLAASDELEGTGADLLARACHADDDRLAPATVRTFQRSARPVLL